jgi:hypothetical protein
MHSPNRALPGIEREICLCNYGLEPMRSKLILAESAGEKSAFVYSALELDDVGPAQVCFCENHPIVVIRR